MIYVLAKFTIRPGQRTAFLEHARRVTAETVQEKGCIDYYLAESLTDPNCFTGIERWMTREALSKHFETTHLKKWASVLGPLTQKIETDVIHPAHVEAL